MRWIALSFYMCSWNDRIEGCCCRVCRTWISLRRFFILSSLLIELFRYILTATRLPFLLVPSRTTEYVPFPTTWPNLYSPILSVNSNFVTLFLSLPLKDISKAYILLSLGITASLPCILGNPYFSNEPSLQSYIS